MVNDYELIYLYKTAREEEILRKIIDKYRPLIYKYIYKFYIHKKDQEDFYQEGILTLLECINQFDESFNKTFTRFFELVLFRRFIHLKDKFPKYVLVPQPELIQATYEETYDMFSEEVISFGKFEQTVYDLYFKKRLTVDGIAKHLKKDKKAVKNALHRVKVKLKAALKDQVKINM